MISGWRDGDNGGFVISRSVSRLTSLSEPVQTATLGDVVPLAVVGSRFGNPASPFGYDSR